MSSEKGGEEGGEHDVELKLGKGKKSEMRNERDVRGVKVKAERLYQSVQLSNLDPDRTLTVRYRLSTVRETKQTECGCAGS